MSEPTDSMYAMPKSPAGRYSARPATTRSTMLPGAGDTGADDLLRARQTTLNTTRFTAEHMAAYAAFAGITDRPIALDLHRHHVDWDAVNGYTAHGVEATAYETMKSLAAAGVTPDLLQQWRALRHPYSTQPRFTSIAYYAQAGLTPTQVQPYLVNPYTATLSDQYIAAFAVRGIDSDAVGNWKMVGIETPSTVGLLVESGCDPSVVRDFTTRNRRSTRWGVERAFTKVYTAIARAAQNPALTKAALRCGATAEEVTGWRATDLPVDRIADYLNAGIHVTEWHADPTVREVDTATLHMLAAMQGHPVPQPALAC